MGNPWISVALLALFVALRLFLRALRLLKRRAARRCLERIDPDQILLGEREAVFREANGKPRAGILHLTKDEVRFTPFLRKGTPFLRKGGPFLGRGEKRVPLESVSGVGSREIGPRAGGASVPCMEISSGTAGGMERSYWSRIDTESWVRKIAQMLESHAESG